MLTFFNGECLVRILIQSFGYSCGTGYLVDEISGRGGFIFDCRGIDIFDYSLRNNPVAPLSHFNLTGLDPRITGPLDRDPDVQRFFKAVWIMVKMDVDKRLSRGFKSMTVSFGCTAGQHRSVYMAERLAKEIKHVFPDVEVEVVHSERAHWPLKS